VADGDGIATKAPFPVQFDFGQCIGEIGDFRILIRIFALGQNRLGRVYILVLQAALFPFDIQTP